MQKNYYNKGEANTILANIRSWAYSNRDTVSNTTLDRIEKFINTELSAEDREAVRLSDFDKWSFQYWIDKKIGDTKGYARLLEIDVDINKLDDVIRGEEKEEI